MNITLTERAMDELRRRGGTAAIDYIGPIG